MGEFVVNCMASGLPIPKGTKTKVLFLLEQEMDRGFGHDPYSFYQCASWPINIVMDDFGGMADYFSSDFFVPNAIQPQELTDQASWNIFYQQLVTEEGHDHSDWVRNMIHKHSGVWGTYLSYRDAFYNIEPKFSNGIEKTYFTYIRQDVWDYLVKQVKEFINKRRLQFKDDMSKPTEFELYLRKNCADIDVNTVMWGGFLSRRLQNLLTTKRLVGRFNDKILFDIRLTDETQEDLIKQTVELDYFIQGLELACRPLMPRLSMAPQGAEHDREYLTSQLDFHNACAGFLKKHLASINE